MKVFVIRILQKLLWVLQRLGFKRDNEIHYIGSSESLPPPLSAEEEQELLSRYTGQEQDVRQKLIEHNLRLVVYIARKFDNTGVGTEDLVSIGTIGLIKAVNTYRADKNTKLATYASRCIENEILMYLRKTANQRSEVSIDEPLNTDWDGNELLLSDILGTDPDVVMRPVEDDAERNILLELLGKLPQREQTIIAMRFGLGGRDEMTQKEVADALGISQSYISRLEKKIINRLRKDLSRVM